MDNEMLKLKLEANSAKIGMVQAQSQTLAWQLEALKAERKRLEDMLPKQELQLDENGFPPPPPTLD